MLLHLTEDNKLEITEKALMVEDFQNAYNEAEQRYGKGMGMTVFIFLHYMYHFDSRFFLQYSESKKRVGRIKTFIPRGAEIMVTKKLRKAMDTYMMLYSEEMVSMYTVMHKNIMKLKDYAERMVMIPDIDADDADRQILVDSKEFKEVNVSLPDQVAKLEAFKKRLTDDFKNKVDIFGGGEKGLFE